MSTGPSSVDLSHQQLLERGETLAKENAMLSKTLKAYKEKTVNISRLVDKYKQLQALYKDLQGQKETASAELEQARKALAAAKSSRQPPEVQTLEAHVQKLTAQRDAVQQGLSTCRVERDQMAAKLEQETERSRQLAKERDDLAAVAMDTRILIKDCALEISHLRSEVRDLKRDAAERSCGDIVLSEIASIKAQLVALEQRVSEGSCAQAVADAAVANVNAQQRKNAVELQRIRAVFSAVATPAENSQFAGACMPSPPAHLDTPADALLAGTQCFSPLSPRDANAPSSMSGPTALQRMRSCSPDVVLASATVHSNPQPQSGACTASAPGKQGTQPCTNATGAGEGALPSICRVQHSCSASPRREGSSPPFLMRSSTRCSTVGDTPSHSDCVPVPMQPSPTTLAAAVPGTGGSRSPDATALELTGPRKRPRPDTICRPTTDKCIRGAAADTVASPAQPAVRPGQPGAQAKPANPMKRQPPRPQASQHRNTASTTPAAKVRPRPGSMALPAELPLRCGQWCMWPSYNSSSILCT